MVTGLHEEFAREERIAPASNRRFGLVVGAILLAIGCVRAWLHGEFGAPFELVDHVIEAHRTPWGTIQQFLYCFCNVRDARSRR